MRRRSLVVGAALLGVYLVAIVVTVGLRSDHVRPLYDGFAPPPSYRWVDPPPFFASGNVEPTAVTTSIKLGRDGSAPAGVATPDGQFVINLGGGAVAPRSGAKRVAVKITPVAPDQLGAVPSGLRPNGNAYRIDMTYEPGHSKVERLARPGTLVVEIPELGRDLFTSRPGARWSVVDAQPVPPRQLSLTAPLETPGDYLAATNLPELVAPGGGSSDRAALIGVATAVLAAVVLAAAFVLVRRRRRRVREHPVT